MNTTTFINGSRRALLVAMAFAVTTASVAGIVAKANAITAPRAQISFTFDDGLNSALALAAPALQPYGYTGTDYVISNCARDAAIAGSCAADETKTYMSWDQVKQLRDTWGWEIGSHTESHPLLDPNDTTVPANQRLTAAQITEELKGSQAAIAAATGQTPMAFAAPYGSYDANGQQVVAEAAKYYTSFRGFADYGYNYFPFNNYLLKNLPVQDGALLRGDTVKTNPVTQAKAYIDEAVAGNRWLVLTFHDIVAANAATGADDYDLNVAELKEIAAYAQSKGIVNTNVSNGLVTNPGGGNLAVNSGFDAAIATPSTNTTTFNTDASTTIKQDTANHGTGTGSATSASIASGTADTSLFSNTAAIAQKKYVIQAYLNIQTYLTGTQMTFQVDEYGAAGYLRTVTLLNTPNPAEVNPLVRTVGFEYTPSVDATSARLQIVAKGGSNLQAYVDNVTWFAEDGTTINGTTAVISNGDVNNDGKVNALDLSVVLGNWNKASTTAATGDLNGDKTVNALDLSIVLGNWSK